MNIYVEALRIGKEFDRLKSKSRYLLFIQREAERTLEKINCDCDLCKDARKELRRVLNDND